MEASVPGAQKVEEITVSTERELLAALGSNRRILLNEGVYNLTAAEPGFWGNADVYFEEYYDGPELTLCNVQNLTIESAGDTRSEIVCEPRYAYVMSFLDCTNIRIINIKIGHTEGGECSGGVLSFENSTGISIDNTDMYGCGTTGLYLYQSTDVNVAGSSIYGCTHLIMNIYGSSNIRFTNCVFRDNAGGSVLKSVSNFTIDACSFLRNTDESRLFYLSETENVVVQNSEFVDNVAEKLIYNDKDEFEDSNRFENNTFDEEE